MRKMKAAAVAGVSAGDRLRANPSDAKTLAAEAAKWAEIVSYNFSKQFAVGKRSCARRWAQDNAQRLLIKKAFYRGASKAEAAEMLTALYQDALPLSVA
jgi:hypothetical protein